MASLTSSQASFLARPSSKRCSALPTDHQHQHVSLSPRDLPSFSGLRAITRSSPTLRRCLQSRAPARIVSAATDVSLVDKSVNTIRFLAIDAVEKAKSGHPGLPMGCAPMGHILFDEVMNYNPKNPYWFNRDRFILSAGHGCMLQYALLHLAGYDSVRVSFFLSF